MVSSASPVYTNDLPWFTTARGNRYHPLWQLVPALAPFYTTYEKEYNAVRRLGSIIHHTYIHTSCIIIHTSSYIHIHSLTHSLLLYPNPLTGQSLHLNQEKPVVPFYPDPPLSCVHLPGTEDDDTS